MLDLGVLGLVGTAAALSGKFVGAFGDVGKFEQSLESFDVN